jgi:hypothetical protein
VCSSDLAGLTAGAPRPATASSDNPRGPARARPVERRRAALRVLAAWRDIGRDLVVAASGARREIRHVDLLEELDAAAAHLDVASLIAFLDRLDGLAAAIEAYASPELVLDDLVLAWPRIRVRA